MKTLSSTFRATASGDSNKPVELYDIFLDAETLHLINYDKNITFFDLDGASTEYTAFPCSRDAYERTVENPINSILLSTANVDRSMSSYIATNDFRGRRVVVRKIFADQLTSSGDASVIFDGVMDTPAASEEAIQINATDRIGSLNREAPKRWQQLLCNWKFGDSFCFFSMTSGDMYSTVQAMKCSGDTTDTTLISANLGGYKHNYWRDGEIQITSGQSALKKRKIILSSGDPNYLVKLDSSLPYTPAAGDTFTIRRGCDKSWYRCSGDFSNDKNFGGFPTIPEQMIIR